MFGNIRRVLLAVGLLAVLPGLVDAAGASRRPGPISLSVAAPAFAPAETATIQPGVQTITGAGQCTSNFVFTDATGAVYLGQAAHCGGTGGSTDTDGCTSPSVDLGKEVIINGTDGAERKGTLAYSSWLTMQEIGEDDFDACAFNDLALVKIHPDDVPKVNPSVPFFGGPTGLATAGTKLGDAVYSYGNSSLRLGLSALSPKRGVSVGDTGEGWSHLVYTVTPGIPGDSGSAFLDAGGRALGVLSTLQVLPFVGSNGVGDLSRQLTYLNTHSGLPHISLVNGTTGFSANRLL